MQEQLQQMQGYRGLAVEINTKLERDEVEAKRRSDFLI